MLSKSTLRAEMRARLRAVCPRERAGRSARLVARLVAREDWQRAETVALFAPLRSEPDMDLLWTLPGGVQGKIVVYPRVEPGGLVLRVIDRPEELVATADGRQLREPPAEAPELSVCCPDLLLVPGLAFTAAGARLGRGGGYYDRLLAGRVDGSRGVAVGIGFDFQLLAELPLEPHDVILDDVVTDGVGSKPVVYTRSQVG